MGQTIRIALTGDVYFGDEPALTLAPAVARLFQDADLVVINQEGPITTRQEGLSGKCLLRSGPGSAQRLVEWGVDVASLANNHMFDFGYEGLADTQSALDAAGIQHLGAGADLAEAARPLVLPVGDARIGLLAYSWGFVQTRCATGNDFGCAPLDEQLMLRQVAELRDRADAVLVLPHWGYCGYTLPLPTQLDLGQRLLDAGATAVVGTHAHVVQGLLENRGRVLAANLGNFAFAPYRNRGGMVNERTGPREYFRGAILELRLDGGKVTAHRLIPTRQRDGVIDLDDDPVRARTLTRRAAALIRPDYSRTWRRYVRLRMLRRLLYWANPRNWRRIGRATFKGLWIMARGGRGRADDATQG